MPEPKSSETYTMLSRLRDIVKKHPLLSNIARTAVSVLSFVFTAVLAFLSYSHELVHAPHLLERITLVALFVIVIRLFKSTLNTKVKMLFELIALSAIGLLFVLYWTTEGILAVQLLGGFAAARAAIRSAEIRGFFEGLLLVAFASPIIIGRVMAADLSACMGGIMLFLLIGGLSVGNTGTLWKEQFHSK